MLHRYNTAKNKTLVEDYDFRKRFRLKNSFKNLSAGVALTGGRSYGRITVKRRGRPVDRKRRHNTIVPNIKFTENARVTFLTNPSTKAAPRVYAGSEGGFISVNNFPDKTDRYDVVLQNSKNPYKPGDSNKLSKIAPGI